MQSQARRTTVLIDGHTFDQLAALGRENERSASAEARLAIRRHLQAVQRRASQQHSKAAA